MRKGIRKLGILGMTGLLVFFLGGQDSNHQEVGPGPTTIPDEMKLIGDFSLPSSLNLANLSRWPGQKVFADKKPLGDRRGQFPPTTGREGMEFGGAMPPEQAAEEAVSFISNFMLNKWLPNNLSSRLFLVAAKNPSQSSIWVRYGMDGNQIQIGQTQVFLCVVIRPNLEGRFPRPPAATQGDRIALVHEVAGEFFQFGSNLPKLVLRAVEKEKTTVLTSGVSTQPAEPPAATFLFLDPRTRFSEREAQDCGFWRESLIGVYTDGQTACFIFTKTLLRARSRSLEDPWF